jgi:hypothetical protein
MFKKKPPAITIGSSLGAVHSRSSSAIPFPSAALTTSVQPSALVRAGDALGNLIWKSAPIVKAVALGTAAIALDSNDKNNSPNEEAPWMDMSHPDFLLWRSHMDED